MDAFWDGRPDGARDEAGLVMGPREGVILGRMWVEPYCNQWRVCRVAAPYQFTLEFLVFKLTVNNVLSVLAAHIE